MKRLWKRNQMILTLLAVMIAAAGYLNYIGSSLPFGLSGDGDSEAAEAAQSLLEENQRAAEYGTEEAQPGEAVFTSSEIVEFISQVSLNKEQLRAENREILMEIVNNENLSEGAKQDAVDEMVKMTTVAEREREAETLLAAKGFRDTVVSITEDAVDVVVGRWFISPEEKAQIEDIVTRKTQTDVSQIVISLMASGEMETVEETSTAEEMVQ